MASAIPWNWAILWNIGLDDIEMKDDHMPGTEQDDAERKSRSEHVTR